MRIPLTDGEDVPLCGAAYSWEEGEGPACLPAPLRPVAAAAAAAGPAPPSRSVSGALGALGKPAATVCAVTPEPSAGLLARSRPRCCCCCWPPSSAPGANAELANGEAAIADVEAERRAFASSCAAAEKADGAVPGRCLPSGAADACKADLPSQHYDH